jgi:hypothetical protein
MLKPKIGCRNIKLALRRDRKAAFEEAWVAVPSAVADITLPVGRQSAVDVLLLSVLPFHGQGRGRPATRSRFKAGADHFLFTPTRAEDPIRTRLKSGSKVMMELDSSQP